MSLRVAVVSVLAAALVAACGGATAQPAPTLPPSGQATPPPKPAANPTPTALVAAAPATAAKPAATAAPAAAAPYPAATTVPAAQVAAPAAPAAAKPGGVRLTIQPDGSEARFRAREQLAGRNLPNDAVGATPGVSGTLVLGPNGGFVADASKIVVDLTKLRSDESRRDNWIQRNTLQTSQFPNAELAPREASGLPSPLPTAGEATFTLTGDLTVHGVTRPSSWDVTARFQDGQVTGSASTRVKMTDFGMTPPRVGPVLSIDDELTLEVDIRATREPTF